MAGQHVPLNRLPLSGAASSFITPLLTEYKELHIFKEASGKFSPHELWVLIQLYHSGGFDQMNTGYITPLCQTPGFLCTWEACA